jgi:hypothetical protein
LQRNNNKRIIAIQTNVQSSNRSEKIPDPLLQKRNKKIIMNIIPVPPKQLFDPPKHPITLPPIKYLR